MTVIPVVNGTLGIIPKGIGNLGNNRTSRDHPDYNIIKIGQNIEKSPGDLLSQTHLRNHQLKMTRKILKE